MTTPELSAVAPGPSATETAALNTLQAKLDKGDLTLVCAGGQRVRVHSAVLSMESPVLEDIIRCMPGEERQLKVHEDSADSWLAALLALYPVFPRPPLTLDLCHRLLPVAHKYGMAGLVGEAVAWVAANAHALTHTTQPPHTSLATLLALAEGLQLDEVREVCAQTILNFPTEALVEVLLGVEEWGREAPAFMSALDKAVSLRPLEALPLPTLLRMLATASAHPMPLTRQACLTHLTTCPAAAEAAQGQIEALKGLMAGLGPDTQAQLLQAWFPKVCAKAKGGKGGAVSISGAQPGRQQGAGWQTGRGQAPQSSSWGAGSDSQDGLGVPLSLCAALFMSLVIGGFDHLMGDVHAVESHPTRLLLRGVRVMVIVVVMGLVHHFVWP